MERRFDVMGVSFVDQPFDAAVARLGDAMAGPFGQTVFFANAATLNIAGEDAEYRRALNSATFTFGDGTGVRWAARLRGMRLQANLNGTDVIPALIRRTPGIRVFLLGGDQAFIDRTAARFCDVFPQAVLAGWRNGFFGPQDNDAVLASIRSARPDLLLVGMGNPLQERWISANSDRLAVPLTAGVGGLFSYWAGTLDRAPELYRRAGVEWVHILRRQPHKKRRYLLGSPVFLVRMVMAVRHDVARRAAAAAQGLWLAAAAGQVVHLEALFRA